MKVIGSIGGGRRVFAWRIGDTWYASALEKSINGRYRPIARYDSEQELMNDIRQRGLELVWQEAS